MKKYIVMTIVFVASVAAQAERYFEVFNGTYQVKSKQCQAGDATCANLKFITVGYDSNELRSYVIEQYADGSTFKII